LVRVALIADTHGVLDPRIADAVRRCDFAVHAGDVGSHGVLQALAPRRELVAVAGNNDTIAKWPEQEHAVLSELPEEARLELPGGRLVVVHGDRISPAGQRHARLRRRYAGARLVVYGHSHRLVCDQAGDPWVVNPGAAGRSRTFGGPSMVLLTAGARRWSLEPRRYEPAGKR
jgi:putative phosphoesterase